MNLPCGHIYPGGDRCSAPEEVHRGEHEYVPWDRRSGTDRRASVEQADKGDERLRAAGGFTTRAGLELYRRTVGDDNGFATLGWLNRLAASIRLIETEAELRAASAPQPAPRCPTCHSRKRDRRGFPARLPRASQCDDSWHFVAPSPQPAPELDVDRLADVLHAKVCGPFATIDPQECVAGRARDVRLAEAIAAEYARLSQEGDTGS